MSIRSALGAMPVWPVLVIVPLLTLGVGAFHYIPTYQTCTRLAQAREAFTEAVARTAATPERGLRLEQAVEAGDWDQARVLQTPQVEGPLLDCPFGWDLEGADREALFAQGRMGILAFAKAGQVVDFIEYRSDRVRFEDVAGVIDRAEAVFVVDERDAAQGPFVLRPRGPGS